ncbi:NAD-dependent epimerase [Candidatus Latescibacterota bacterium]
MKIIVTGAAGFIGFHVSQRLLERGDEVIGVDNMNDYYDVSLKEARLSQLTEHQRFSFHKMDVADQEACALLFQDVAPNRVVHLAAQAGVRYSLKNPYAFIDSNLVGFVNILEGCRHSEVEHLVYASSSSVYGNNKTLPFSVSHNVDHPLSLYAATKKANELLAHSYSHLYKLPTTGLRFFTVYGPWGRPDMAYFLFTKAIIEERPIDVYNYGKMSRDFTYIDDIVTGVVKTLLSIPKPDENYSTEKPLQKSSSAPYRIYNIGNNQSVELNYFIELIEKNLGKKAKRNMLPMQPGDVVETYADVDALIRDVGFRPNTTIEMGMECFLRWYCDYYDFRSLIDYPGDE